MELIADLCCVQIMSSTGRPYDIPSRRTFSMLAPICAAFNYCWASAISRPQPAICMSPKPDCTPRRVRSTTCPFASSELLREATEPHDRRSARSGRCLPCSSGPVPSALGPRGLGPAAEGAARYRPGPHCCAPPPSPTTRSLQLRDRRLLLVPAGGLALDRSHWIASRRDFFLPVRVLSRMFRGKLLAFLKRSYRGKQLCFPGSLAALSEPRAFHSLLHTLRRRDWVVYSKPPFGGPEHVLKYLARYTHRVAISNGRLLSLDNGQARFRWRDSSHNNRRGIMTLYD